MYTTGQYGFANARQAGVVPVELDWIASVPSLGRPADVVDIPFERDLGSVDAHHDQSLMLALLGPGTNVGKRPDQLMQVYVQKSMRTTFPARYSASSGGELSQSVARRGSAGDPRWVTSRQCEGC
jgi:hypothetical protein